MAVGEDHREVEELFVPTRILVSIDGGPQDEELLAIACDLARSAHAKLHAVHVIEVKRALPLETDLPAEIEKGEILLQRAEEIARKTHQEIETELLQARDAGTAIVEEAERRAIDLIVIGLKYRKRFDQFHLGSTVMYVLKNSSCRVCVWREPIT